MEEGDLVKLNMMEDAKNVRKISLEKKDNIELFVHEKFLTLKNNMKIYNINKNLL